MLPKIERRIESTIPTSSSTTTCLIKNGFSTNPSQFPRDLPEKPSGKLHNNGFAAKFHAISGKEFFALSSLYGSI